MPSLLKLCYLTLITSEKAEASNSVPSSLLYRSLQSSVLLMFWYLCWTYECCTFPTGVCLPGRCLIVGLESGGLGVYSGNRQSLSSLLCLELKQAQVCCSSPGKGPDSRLREPRCEPLHPKTLCLAGRTHRARQREVFGAATPKMWRKNHPWKILFTPGIFFLFKSSEENLHTQKT